MSLLELLLLPLLLLLVELDLLESLDLHHQVLPLFLRLLLFMQGLLLEQLLIPHSDALGIHHHLVHVLHLVQLFIEDLLGASLHRLLRMLFLQLDVVQRDLLFLFLLQPQHPLLFGLCGGLLLFLLLLQDLLLLQLLVLGADNCRILHPLQLRFWEHHHFRVGVVPLVHLLLNFLEFLRISSHLRLLLLVPLLWLRPVPKQSLLHFALFPFVLRRVARFGPLRLH